MPLNLQDLDRKELVPFYFKEFDGQYLLTNDTGDHCFLTPPAFTSYFNGKIKQAFPDKYSELKNKSFIREGLDFDAFAREYASRHNFLSYGPSLHIIVVTLRCDHKCIYCQAGSGDLKAKDTDMQISTAAKVVDRIFESPNPCITIEFQGGEPLVNWDTVRFIIEYAQKKNKEIKKDLKFTIVSNLTFMTEEILRYAIDNNIHICTSLDGPSSIHNKQRIGIGKKDTHKNTVKWLKVLRREYYKKNIPVLPSALTTITRFSLTHLRSVIDEYVDLGLEGIHLRPVSPFVHSRQAWKSVNFSAEEFVKFYSEALDYIIELNLKGKNFHERFAFIFLTKIIARNEPNYLDIRSPCGAGTGQLAYNFNGDVYTCDEARMFSRVQDESFRIGNVEVNSHEEMIKHPVVRALCVSSCLDNLPVCSDCVYKPYCGVCPVYNYKEQGDLFGKHGFLCRINKGILDYLFRRIQEDAVKDVFYKWLKIKGGV